MLRVRFLQRPVNAVMIFGAVIGTYGNVGDDSTLCMANQNKSALLKTHPRLIMIYEGDDKKVMRGSETLHNGSDISSVVGCIKCFNGRNHSYTLKENFDNFQNFLYLRK